jgi:hypothetical protein
MAVAGEELESSVTWDCLSHPACVDVGFGAEFVDLADGTSEESYWPLADVVARTDVEHMQTVAEPAYTACSTFAAAFGWAVDRDLVHVVRAAAIELRLESSIAGYGTTRDKGEPWMQRPLALDFQKSSKPQMRY